MTHTFALFLLPLWFKAAGWGFVAGDVLFSNLSVDVVVATTAVAASAILAMPADIMRPEEFADAHNFAGLITVWGFLAAFVRTKLGD